MTGPASTSRASVPDAVDVEDLRIRCRAGKRLSEAHDFSFCGSAFQGVPMSSMFQHSIFIDWLSIIGLHLQPLQTLTSIIKYFDFWNDPYR